MQVNADGSATFSLRAECERDRGRVPFPRNPDLLRQRARGGRSFRSATPATWGMRRRESVRRALCRSLVRHVNVAELSEELGNRSLPDLLQEFRVVIRAGRARLVHAK